MNCGRPPAGARSAGTRRGRGRVPGLCASRDARSRPRVLEEIRSATPDRRRLAAAGLHATSGRSASGAPGRRRRPSRSTSACATGSPSSGTPWRAWRPTVERIVAICLAPQYSKLSVGFYFRRTQEAKTRAGLQRRNRLDKSFHDHPLLIEAFAEKLAPLLPAERRCCSPPTACRRRSWSKATPTTRKPAPRRRWWPRGWGWPTGTSPIRARG